MPENRIFRTFKGPGPGPNFADPARLVLNDDQARIQESMNDIMYCLLLHDTYNKSSGKKILNTTFYPDQK